MRTTTLVGTFTLLAGLAACSTDSATGSPFGDAASPFVNADVAMVAALVKAEMEGAVTLSVPLKVDTGWAHTWAEAH